jgi:hypothetical protein
MTSTAKAALATLLAIAATAPPSALARSMVRPASTIPPTPMQPGDSIERVDVQLSFMTGARVPVIRVERKTEAFMKRMYGYVTVGTLRKRMIEQDVFGIFGNLQQQKKHAESHSVPVSTIPAQGADIVDEIRSQGANQRKGDNIASRQCREAMKPGVAFYNDMDKIQFFVDGREERLNEGVNLVKLAEQGIVEEAPFGHHRGPNAEKPVRTDADMQELVTSARAASAAREERGGEVPKLTLRVLLKQKSVPEYFMEHFPRDAPGSYSTPRWFASADPNSFNTPS